MPRRQSEMLLKMGLVGTTFLLGKAGLLAHHDLPIYLGGERAGLDQPDDWYCLLRSAA